MAPGLHVALLPGGDVSQAPLGTHLVLEASGGALMHALRMPEGLFSLRGGCVRTFQVMRSLPSAAAVHYPPPLGPSCDADRAQAVERALGLVGLGQREVASHLERAGADARELAAGGEALASELLCSLCATGAARNWSAADAYRVERRRASAAAADAPLGSQAPAAPSRGAAAVARPLWPEEEEAGAASARTCGAAAGGLLPSSRQGSSASTSPPPAASPLLRSEGSAGRSGSSGWSDASVGEGSGAGSPSRSPAVAEDSNAALKTKLQEKAITTAVHLGLRGTAARAAGAVAAVGCEGYALYKEIAEHSEQLCSRNISEGQYQERVCESAISSSGRAFGGLAGAAAGQAAIPVPIVGAVVGGVIGAACGGMHASSLARGAWRLSGAKAKGGDDLVRCVEHQPEKAEAPAGGLVDDFAPKDLGSNSPVPAASGPRLGQQREEDEEQFLL